MALDSVQAVLLVLLGSCVSYTLDEQFALTPRLTDWLGRLFDGE